jgi:hypothetical protein
VTSGDYLVVPRATTHRWVPIGEEPLSVYCIESSSHIAPPKRYLSKYANSSSMLPTANVTCDDHKDCC